MTSFADAAEFAASEPTDAGTGFADLPADVTRHTVLDLAPDVRAVSLTGASFRRDSGLGAPLDPPTLTTGCIPTREHPLLLEFARNGSDAVGFTVISGVGGPLPSITFRVTVRATDRKGRTLQISFEPQAGRTRFVGFWAKFGIVEVAMWDSSIGGANNFAIDDVRWQSRRHGFGEPVGTEPPTGPC